MKRRYIPWLLGALPFVGISLALAVPAFRSDSGIQFSSKATSGVDAGKGGLWWDGTAVGPLWRKPDGSDARVLTANSAVLAPSIDRSNAGSFAVCDTNCTTLALGHAGIAITGSPGSYSMTPSGALTLTAGIASTFDTGNGTVRAGTFDRSTAGSITIGGTATGLAFSNSIASVVIGGSTLAFSNAAGNKTIGVSTAATDTAGSQLALSGGFAGAAATANGKTGGVFDARSGAGADGAGSFTGGASGTILILSGTGGAGTATAVAGASGNVTIQSGAGGTNNGGGGAISGEIRLNVGAPTGVAAQGKVAFQNNGVTDIAYYPVTRSLVSNTSFAATLGNSGGGEWGAIYSRHYHGSGSAPAIAVGSAAQLGTGPTTIVHYGSDASGTIIFTSGTTPSAFVANTPVSIGTITFSSAYVGGAPRSIVIAPASNTSAALSTGASEIAFYADYAAVATSQITIKAISSGTPSFAASTAYPLAYMVIQ